MVMGVLSIGFAACASRKIRGIPVIHAKSWRVFNFQSFMSRHDA